MEKSEKNKNDENNKEGVSLNILLLKKIEIIDIRY